MTEPSAVRVRWLRKRYRTVTAVDGVDLDIAYGEVFALLGSNGAAQGRIARRSGQCGPGGRPG